MGNHQSLYRQGILLNQTRDTRIGINDNLIAQTLLSVLIALICFNKFLTKLPVGVVDRHTNTGMGIHHLFRGDYFNLLRTGIESIKLGYSVISSR